MDDDLAKRVAAALSEAKVTVKGHTRRSEKGKVFTVKQYDREVSAVARKAGVNDAFFRKVDNELRFLQKLAREAGNDPELIDSYKMDADNIIKTLNIVKAGKFEKALDYIENIGSDDIESLFIGVIKRGMRLHNETKSIKRGDKAYRNQVNKLRRRGFLVTS